MAPSVYPRTCPSTASIKNCLVGRVGTLTGRRRPYGQTGAAGRAASVGLMDSAVPCWRSFRRRSGSRVDAELLRLVGARAPRPSSRRERRTAAGERRSGGFLESLYGLSPLRTWFQRVRLMKSRSFNSVVKPFCVMICGFGAPAAGAVVVDAAREVADVPRSMRCFWKMSKPRADAEVAVALVAAERGRRVAAQAIRRRSQRSADVDARHDLVPGRRSWRHEVILRPQPSRLSPDYCW